MKKLTKNLKKNKLTILFFGFLFSLIIFLMRNAFFVDIYVDDYFFFKVSKADNITSFIKLFSPFKDYFYRPIPTELFYFLLNILNKNLFIAHAISFITYFVGLIFLYKSINFITKSQLFASVFIFIYGINFTHVFQIYQLNTFQEICLLTFLSIAFYLFLIKRYLLSLLFYIFALMSKETAILFPILLVIYQIISIKKISKKNFYVLMPFLLISIIFLLLYIFSSLQVTKIDTYQINFSPKLIINNVTWYILWGLGIPNFIPNYIQSILLKPLPEFWNLMTSVQIRIYFYSIIAFYALFFPMLIVTILKQRELRIKYLSFFILMIFLFLLFLAPTIPIIHRWMVRLTIPSVFICLAISLPIYLGLKQQNILRFIAIAILVIYVFSNMIGIKLHESSGLFEMNSQTIGTARDYFKENNASIIRLGTIYFVDSSKKDSGGSEELKNMLGGDFFIDTFFPKQNIKVIYGHEQSRIPPHSFVIYSNDILKW